MEDLNLKSKATTYHLVKILAQIVKVLIMAFLVTNKKWKSISNKEVVDSHKRIDKFFKILKIETYLCKSGLKVWLQASSQVHLHTKRGVHWAQHNNKGLIVAISLLDQKLSLYLQNRGNQGAGLLMVLELKQASLST